MRDSAAIGYHWPSFSQHGQLHCTYMYIFNDNYMLEGDTPLPPCALCTALFWPHILCTVYQQKMTILGIFIYMKKIK